MIISQFYEKKKIYIAFSLPYNNCYYIIIVTIIIVVVACVYNTLINEED